jgi:hypothetical protein
VSAAEGAGATPAMADLEQLRAQRRALIQELAQVRFDRDVFARLMEARTVERDCFRNEVELLRAELARCTREPA